MIDKCLAISSLCFLIAIPFSSPPALGAGVLGAEAVQVETVFEPSDAPVSLLLSKSLYPAEDGHLDAIVWLHGPTGAQAEGELRVALRGEGGTVLAQDAIRPVPGGQVFFSFPFLAALAGQQGTLHVEWTSGGRTLGQAEGAFSVMPPANPLTSGRIRLTVPNATGAVLRGAPMTIGVPFPRGALHDERHVRLVDGQGEEVPLQTKVTSRWSRFGSIRWLLCDFTADVDGDGLELHLEYGPDVMRADGGAIWAGPDEGEGFPRVEAGPLLFDERGVHFDAQGGGAFEKVLDAEALRGAFVEHENGKVFAMPADVRYRIEESGQAKAVVLREGWYVHPESGERFCKFVTRFVVHKGSPLLRVFHTWIFTGDAYQDRIANMGWRLPLAENFRPEGFLSNYGEGGEWLQGDWLVHRDFEEYELGGPDGVRMFEGQAAGVFAASGGRTRLTVGVRDFHQNYPRELEFADGTMAFYEWPRHGRRPRHTAHHEAPHRLWFAHEGEMLDFALPVEYTQEPIILEIARSRRHSPGYTYQGVRQQYVNAQGIAKTAELWLHFSSRAEPAEQAERTLAGLSEQTLRAVADPRWVAASGAFHEIRHRDAETFPQYERAYEMHALAPKIWAERAHTYGKWLWGVTPHQPDLLNRYQEQHRAFRKSHQGWPYSWLPFARSGDARFLKYADAVTTFQTDIAFCHYSDERVLAYGEDRPRARGWYTRDRIPWAHNRRMPTSRAREDKVHYLWDAYYLTGHYRARDVALDFGELTKHEGAGATGRWECRMALDYDEDSRCTRVMVTLLRTYTEMYQATFDPWFLAAAHRIARRVVRLGAEEIPAPTAIGYNTGLQDFHRFTGDPAMREVILGLVGEQSQQREAGLAGHWDTVGGTMIGRLAYAWHLNGDEFFRQRLVGWLERAAAATYDGEPDYYRGVLVRARQPAHFPTFTGWFLEHFPFGLQAIADAVPKPASVASAFWQGAAYVETLEGGAYRHRLPTIALLKEEGKALPVALRIQPSPGGRRFRYEISGPGGMRLSGDWDVREEKTVEIPDRAPAGVYRLRVEGESATPLGGIEGGTPWMYVPVAPPGTGEVFELRAGEAVGPASAYAHYWFMVPDDLEEFSAVFHVPHYSDKDCPLVRFTVWNADGELAWVRQFSRAEEPETETLRAEVAVPEGQSGRLWQIILPHQRNARDKPAFTLDERIPGIVATSPDRWFDPR